MEEIVKIPYSLGEYINRKDDVSDTLWARYLKKTRKFESILIGTSGKDWANFIGRWKH